MIAPFPCNMTEEDAFYASFEPSDAKQLTHASNTQLLLDNPILALALLNIFPYLLLIDNVLEVITWTNDDPYQNFILVVLYSVLVMYWHLLKYVVLPILLLLTFSCVVWSVSLVIYDSKHNEKPTIDEVLHTLHNLTIRFELILRPVQHVRLRPRNYVNIILAAALLTPIHVGIVKVALPPQKLLWLGGLFVLTYHSAWSYSVRRLLWRLVYLRILAFYVTGLNIKLTRKNRTHHKGGISRIHTPSTSDVDDEGGTKLQLLSDFKIIKKSVTSPTQLRQIVLFEVLENERRWIGLGWSKFLLPNERPVYCYEKSRLAAPEPKNTASGETEAEYPFPVFENDLYSYLWEWLDDNWKLDLEFNKGKSKDAWVYYDSKWGNEGFSDGFSKYTRSRRWTRKAVLEIDKQDIVYDE